MSDEIENLLRQYRPAGPRPELRRRILVTRAAPAWPWAAAAAALLVATIGLHAAVRGGLAAAYEPPPDPWVAATESLSQELGGTPEARAAAEAWAMDERRRAARSADTASGEGQ